MKAKTLLSLKTQKGSSRIFPRQSLSVVLQKINHSGSITPTGSSSVLSELDEELSELPPPDCSDPPGFSSSPPVPELFSVSGALSGSSISGSGARVG